MPLDLSPHLHAEGPWWHRIALPASDLFDALHAWEASASHGHGRRVARSVRGAKATTKAHCFDEIAAALQFPFYFGENWDALHDCLSDLTWLHADTVLIAVIDSDRLLEHAPAEERDRFRVVVEEAMRCITDLASQARSAHSRPPRSLHVLLHSEEAAAAAVEALWPETVPISAP